MATLAMEERPYRLLLVVGFLSALLPAAAATVRPQQPGGPCDTTKLANHVLSFCTPYTPRDGQCCEKVVTAVDFGGAAACLRRLAADPQLVMAGVDATELVALYKSCDGGRLTGSAGLTVAKGVGTSAGRPKSFKKKQVEKEVYERREESIEEEHEEVEKIEKHIGNPNLGKPKSIKAKDVDVDRTAGLSRREREELEKQRSILHYKKLQEEGKTDQARKDLDRLAQIRQKRVEAAKKRKDEKAGCNSSELALSIVKKCIYNFTSAVTGCCSFILPTVDIENCLCMVAEEPDIVGAGITSRSLSRLYVRCGGKRRANDNLAQNCDDTSGGTIPISPPPPDVGVRDEPKELARSKSLNGVEVSTDVGTWILVFFIFCAVVGGAIYSWKTGLCLRGPVDDTEIDQELESAGGDADRDRAAHTPCHSNLQKSLSTPLDMYAEKADLSMKTLAVSLPADDANVFGPRAPGSSSCKPIAPSPSTAACFSPWSQLPNQKIGLASAGRDQNKICTI